VGVDVRRYLFNSYVIGPNTFIFTGSRSGNALADFLFGLPTQTISLTGNPAEIRAKPRGRSLPGDWKIHPRLTLNYGLRWEYYGRITEKNQQTVHVGCGLQLHRIAGVDIGRGWFRMTGTIWRLDWDLRIALRPGEHSHRDSRRSWNLLRQRHAAQFRGQRQSTVCVDPEICVQYFPSMTLSNPFPASSSNPALSPVTLDSAYRDTYLEDWSLGVQHELG